MTPTEALELLDEMIDDVEAAETSDRFAGMDYTEPQLRRGVAAELAELRRVMVAAIGAANAGQDYYDAMVAWLKAGRPIARARLCKTMDYALQAKLAAFDAATKGTTDGQ